VRELGRQAPAGPVAGLMIGMAKLQAGALAIERRDNLNPDRQALFREANRN